jgi:preprotein translocase subunit YajC
MFVTPAFAQAAGGAGGFGGLGGLESLLPLVLIFVVFYFLLIRPQQKKQKQHREMLSALRRGDRVVTAGGIIGQVIRVVNDGEVIVEIADGVRIRQVRGMITDVLAKTEPKGEEAGEEESEPADSKKS